MAVLVDVDEEEHHIGHVLAVVTLHVGPVNSFVIQRSTTGIGLVETDSLVFVIRVGQLGGKHAFRSAL